MWRKRIALFSFLALAVGLGAARPVVDVARIALARCGRESAERAAPGAGVVARGRQSRGHAVVRLR